MEFERDEAVIVEKLKYETLFAQHLVNETKLQDVLDDFLKYNKAIMN